MRILSLVYSVALALMSFTVSALSSLIPNFTSASWRDLTDTPRSIFETRRMGLC